tara:strand:+ start:17218 stop:17694 length:477 start_codon:yes stop_codon:yes gene_type:complete
MPVPLSLVNDSSYYSDNSGKESFIDISFLTKKLPIKTQEDTRRTVTAADKNASLLMELWANSEKNSDETFGVGKNPLTARDMSRLKTYGLIEGDNAQFSITNKGKAVITVMALGETNTFEKKRINKSYTEILAGANKKGKPGYRIPKFATNSHLIQNG